MNLRDYDWVCVNTSSGKDSQTAMQVVCDLAEKQGVLDRVMAIHCDLGRLEWPGVLELARTQSEDYYHLPLRVVSRIGSISEGRFKPESVVPLYYEGEPRGDMLEQAWRRHLQLKAQGITAPPWFSPTNRYCTSDFKTGPVYKYYTQLAKWWIKEAQLDRPCRILDVLGLRAEESTGRAKKDQISFGKRSSGNRVVDQWLPIQHYKERDVWETIKRSGVPYHPAYDFDHKLGTSLNLHKAVGMPRLSCILCCYAPAGALALAARHAPPELLQAYSVLEKSMGYTFKPEVSIEEVLELAKSGLNIDAGNGDWGM